ncbi:hypothetical protein H0H93_005079, partial [Arthromyces matolae]
MAHLPTECEDIETPGRDDVEEKGECQAELAGCVDDTFLDSPQDEDASLDTLVDLGVHAVVCEGEEVSEEREDESRTEANEK